MSTTDVTTHDKLEQMLREGKISEEDFERLASAAERSPAAPERGEEQPRGRTEFRRSFDKGVIGGVCAGIADHHGWDVNSVRMIAVIGTLILSVVGGLGLLIIISYFIVCAFIPYDEPEKAAALRATGRPNLFMSAAFSLFFLLPLIYAHLLGPWLENIYERMGIAVWSEPFQSTIPGRAIDVMSEYAGWPILHLLLFLGLAVLLTLFVGVVHGVLCREIVRRRFSQIIVTLGVLWTLFIVAGSLWPLVGMWTPL